MSCLPLPLLCTHLYEENELRHICKAKNCTLEEVKHCIPLIFVGNKSDLEHERGVSVLQSQQFARKVGVPLIETSAKTSSNVNLCFPTLIQEWARKIGAFRTLRELPIWPDLIESDTATVRSISQLQGIPRDVLRELLLFCVSHGYCQSTEWILEEYVFSPADCLIRGTSFITEALHQGDQAIIDLLLRHHLDSFSAGENTFALWLLPKALRTTPRPLRLAALGKSLG